VSGKLIITRGLPGSGKTTWAKDYCAVRELGERVRVNRDDLRAMLFGAAYRPSYELEQTVTEIQHNAIRALLRAGKTAVADDTNLVLKHAKAFSRLAYEEGAEFEVNDSFLRTDLNECKRRNADRPVETRVPEHVIDGMYTRYIKGGLQVVPPYEPPAGQEVEPYVRPSHFWPVPKAILVDIDGTVALMGDRGSFDWARVGEDEPNKAVVLLVLMLQHLRELQMEWGTNYDLSNHSIIFMSGRDAVCATETRNWLKGQGFYNFDLFMRPEGDNRKDSIVKLELFNEHIRDHYDVQFVLDDRDQVVEMWRKLGLTCLQVAPGDF
jgi:predicted kinase